MTDEGSAAKAAEAANEAPSARGRSTIEFPYLDLANAIEVAQAVHEVAGGMSADTKQLAVKLQMAPDGGAFRVRLMTAKTFRLVEYGRGDVELTELGMRVVDPDTEKEARLESFMSVPLYKALFDKLNGQPLPPQPAVERMAAQLGVAPKQTDRARQAFMRSAKAAGLFELSGERLSFPPGAKRGQGAEGGTDGKVRQDSSGGKGGGRGDPPTPGTLRFEVPIPGKPSAVVIVPGNLDAEDWSMLSEMMTIYIGRWKNFKKPTASDAGVTGADGGSA